MAYKIAFSVLLFFSSCTSALTVKSVINRSGQPVKSNLGTPSMLVLREYERPAEGEKPISGVSTCDPRTVAYDGACPIDRQQFDEIDKLIRAMVKSREKLGESGPACKFNEDDFAGLKIFVKVNEVQRKNLCLWSGIGKGDGHAFVDNKVQPNCFRLEATVLGRYLVKNYPRNAEKTPNVCCAGFKACHLPDKRDGKVNPVTGKLSESDLFHGLWALASRTFAEEVGKEPLRAYFSSAGTTPRNGQPSKLAGETFLDVELPQLARSKKMIALKVFIADDPKNKPEGRPILDCKSMAYFAVRDLVNENMKWDPKANKVTCQLVNVAL